jgi:hypothetical protein
VRLKQGHERAAVRAVRAAFAGLQPRTVRPMAARKDSPMERGAADRA